MYFVLGILVGIVAMIAYSQYLAERQRKQRKKDIEDAQNQLRGFFDTLGFKPLQQQLNEALAREDFKEAARIRDIMNKQ